MPSLHERKLYMKPLFDSSKPNYHGKMISGIVGRTVGIRLLHSFGKAFHAVNSFQISVDDGLPRSICQYCVVQLMDVIRIKNIAAETNKNMVKFRSTLNDFLGGNDDK